MARESMRRWQREHPENMRANSRRCYWKDVHKSRRKGIESYLRHRAERDAKVRQWTAAHPGRQNLYNQAHAANKRYPGKVTGQDIADIIARCEGRCCWCNVLCEGSGKDRLTIEHLKPINDPKDPLAMSVACNSCNAKRRHVTDWPRFAIRPQPTISKEMLKSNPIPEPKWSRR